MEAPQFDEKYDRGAVFAVIGDPPRGIFGTWEKLAEAAEVAYGISGYVVKLPVVADMRQSAWTQNPDRNEFERFEREEDY